MLGKNLLSILLLLLVISLSCSEKEPIDALRFNPAEGTVIIEPEGKERGYWAGAPGIFYDEEKQLFYLTYRLHTHETYPNTDVMKRGHIARIATSENGVDFKDILEFKNEDFKSSSLGRAAIVKCDDGKYRYYMCHDNPEETQWVIGYLEAPEIEKFNPDGWQPVFTSGEATKESLRDPYVFYHEGIYNLLVNIEKIFWLNSDSEDYDEKYAGVTVKRSTGLAKSTNGVNFDWKGDVFAPSKGEWDADCARIGSIHSFGNRFVAYYDGSAGYENNHEDFCALAIGSDIANLKPVKPERFLVKSPWGTGSCRYVDAVVVEEKIYIYYECCREDGSHNLRVVVKEF